MKKLGICIIGAGHMGRIHATCWGNVEQAQIVAIVDPDQELAQVLAGQYGAEVFGNYQTAVSLPEVDVVSVCTPTFLHAELTKFAAQLGKHVLCEKPIALTLEDANGMLQSAQQHGTHLMIGLMRRFSTITQPFKQWIQERHLGNPLVAQTTNIFPLRPKRAMHDAGANGGPLIDMIIHFVDLWRIIFNAEPVSVMAHGGILARDRAEIAHIKEMAVDTAVILIQFESGDIANIFVSWGMPPDGQIKLHEERILGQMGMITTQFSMDEQRITWHKEDGSKEILFEAEGKWSMYQNEISVFASEILKQKPNYETAVAAIKGLEVSLAALQSVESGEIVYLRG